ncbi:hypothetical protein ACFQU2_36380 [Siccirubricoccus deserti]
MPPHPTPPPEGPQEGFLRRFGRLTTEYFNGEEKGGPVAWPPACWR